MSKPYYQIRNQQNTQFKHKPKGMRKRRHYLWFNKQWHAHWNTVFAFIGGIEPTLEREPSGNRYYDPVIASLIAASKEPFPIED